MLITRFFLFSAILLISSGCGSFRVLLPEAMQTSSQDFVITDANKIQIKVQFNKAVDLATMLSLVNVILETENLSGAAVISPGNVASEAIITTIDDVGDLCNFDPDCSFKLFMFGSGTGNPITSTSGEVLDGDNNGSPGGVYETTFVIIG